MVRYAVSGRNDPLLSGPLKFDDFPGLGVVGFDDGGRPGTRVVSTWPQFLRIYQGGAIRPRPCSCAFAAA